MTRKRDKTKRKKKAINITQPTNLERLAIKKFAAWIPSQARALTDLLQQNPILAEEILYKQIEMTQNYIERYLPGVYYNKIFKEVIQSLPTIYQTTKWSSKACGRMIEPLLSKNLTVLCVPSGWDIFKASIESKCKELTGLEDLNVPHNTQEDVVLKLIENSHGLKRLTVYAMPVTNVLKSLVTNCELIEELSFSDCNLSDEDMNMIIEFRNLRSVELIRENGVSENSIEKLLMSCDNLERVYIYPFKDILEVIERVGKLKDMSGKQLKLNSFDNISGRTLEQMQIFFRNCPYLNKVSLDKITNYILKDQIYLEPLKELRHLRTLKLWDFGFYSDRVNEVIEVIGRNLSHLLLWRVKELDLNSLKHISTMCPRLQNLEIGFCRFVNETLVQESTSEMEPSFEHLENFLLRCQEDLQPTSEQLNFLLTNQPRVAFIELDDINMLQDTISSVLDKNPKNFMHLKVFKTNGHFSLLVIDRIVQNCIHPPRVIARLAQS